MLVSDNYNGLKLIILMGVMSENPHSFINTSLNRLMNVTFQFTDFERFFCRLRTLRLFLSYVLMAALILIRSVQKIIESFWSIAKIVLFSFTKNRSIGLFYNCPNETRIRVSIASSVIIILLYHVSVTSFHTTIPLRYNIVPETRQIILYYVIVLSLIVLVNPCRILPSISVSAFLTVCLSICLSVCLLAYLVFFPSRYPEIRFSFSQLRTFK